MSLNLEALIAQRAEATGVHGERVPFTFGDKTFDFRDPLLLSDEDKDELSELEWDADVAEWYMGEEQYQDFVSTTVTINGVEHRGSANFFMLVFMEYQKTAQGTDESGKASRLNRSSRRAAARKQPKQR